MHNSKICHNSPLPVLITTSPYYTPRMRYHSTSLTFHTFTILICSVVGCPQHVDGKHNTITSRTELIKDIKNSHKNNPHKEDAAICQNANIHICNTCECVGFQQLSCVHGLVSIMPLLSSPQVWQLNQHSASYKWLTSSTMSITLLPLLPTQQ